MELFYNSFELKHRISIVVLNVQKVYPKVELDEYIVVPKLNNYIILRFHNNDIESLTYDDLNKREIAIRDIVGKEYFVNFLGSDYSIFGLNLTQLSFTLSKCNDLMDKIPFHDVPSYYERIQNDINCLKKDFDIDSEIWEVQLRKGTTYLLYFSIEENTDIVIGNIHLIPVKYDLSFEGIVKVAIYSHLNRQGFSELLMQTQ